MTLKFQMEFRMGGDGWSETLYGSGTVPQAADSAAKALVTARLKCLTNQAICHHYRISLVGGASPSWRQPVTTQTGGWNAARDVGPVTTNIAVYTEAGLRRTIQLHGVPDSSHSYDANGIPNFTLDGKVATYLQYLADNQFQIRVVAQRAAARTGPFITGITVVAGVVTFTGTFGVMANGQKWRVSGATGQKARQWNGVWKVGTFTGTPATAFTSSTKRLIDPTATYDASSAQLRLAEGAGFLYPAIKTFSPTDTNGTRRTGRPTDSPRGKQSLKR